MRDLLRTLASRGTTVFLNSHLLTEVEQVCDRVAIVRAGRVVATGTPAEIAGAQLGVRVRAVANGVTLRAVVGSIRRGYSRRRRCVRAGRRERSRSGRRRRTRRFRRARLRRFAGFAIVGGTLPRNDECAVMRVAVLTAVEIVRRRFALLALIGIVALAALTGWGLHAMRAGTGAHPHGMSPANARQMAAFMLPLISYLFSFMLAFAAAMSAATMLSAEVESGVLLPILARPLSRTAIVFGKAMGLTAVVAAFAALLRPDRVFGRRSHHGIRAAASVSRDRRARRRRRGRRGPDAGAGLAPAGDCERPRRDSVLWPRVVCRHCRHPAPRSIGTRCWCIPRRLRNCSFRRTRSGASPHFNSNLRFSSHSFSNGVAGPDRSS